MHGDESACPSSDGQSAFLRACSDLAALRLKFAGARVVGLLKLDRRYREDQPRVPAGNPDGGQWNAIARARERIPGYTPQASMQETIEGEIDKNEADARDAEAA